MCLNRKVIKVIILSCVLLPSLLFAKEFNLKEAVSKCQKCHGEKFDKQVLHVTKKIADFSKKELLASFDGFLNASSGGKKGLMKIVLKRYTKEQREQIADFIINNK